MLCLKMDEDWAKTTKDLVQVLLFDKECNLKEGQESVQEFIPEDEEAARKKQIELIMKDERGLTPFQVEELKKKIKKEEDMKRLVDGEYADATDATKVGKSIWGLMKEPAM